MNNEMKLSFPSCSSNEGFARAAVAAFVAQLDPTIEELSDLKTAVSEAVTNCIVHGYRDAIGIIYITATLSEDRRITVKIRDKGCGIPDIQQAMEPFFPPEARSVPDGIFRDGKALRTLCGCVLRWGKEPL